MTVAAQTPYAASTGTGVATVFPVSFRIDDEADAVARIDGVTLASSDFSITGLGADTCSFVFLAAPANGALVEMMRISTLARATNYASVGDLRSEVVNDDFDRLWLALQEVDTGARTPSRALRAPIGETVDDIPDALTRASHLLGFDATGQPMAVAGAAGDSATTLALDLASATSGKGDALIAVKRTETGAIATTQHVANQSRPLDAVMDFGCDNTGATNTTTALKAFYDACINNEVPGYIPAGTYKITTGVLAWDNGFVNTPFPYIETAGYYQVTFTVDSATDTDEPILSWTNGTASSGGGQVWRGGYHGGITITDSTGAVAPNRHGLLLRGLWQTRFGYIVVNSGRANAVHLEQKLYSSTNPDPYAVTRVEFDGVEANNCKGWAFYNDNWVGFNLCTIGFLRAILCEGGVFYGCGAANTIHKMSVGSCAGWAVDDGGFTAVTGGRPELFRLLEAEIDDPENGFRINAMQNYSISARIIHRMDGWSSDANPLNTSGGYWPRTAVSLAGGTSPATKNGTIELIHRIEAGGVKANVGTFINANSSAGAVTTTIDNLLIDNAGFGFVDTDLFTGVNTNSTLLIRRDQRPIADTRIKLCAIAVANGSTSIPTSGWATSTSALIYGGTEEYDFSSLHNTSTGGVTIPYTGLYRVAGQYALTAASGTLMRIGVLRDRGGSFTLVGEHYQYKVNAGAEHIFYSRVHYFNQGDVIYIAGQQNTAGALAPTAVFSHSADNYFIVESL